jgi:isopentenyl-diphosphate delta-isomerase
MKHEELTQADVRKQHHLDLALSAQNSRIDERFTYNPMLAAHPTPFDTWPIEFAGKKMNYPIWISSMTGGTSQAGPINKILAKTAAQFGFGMGLGSCRIILDDNTYFEDFNLRPILGDSLPFFANIGIAQLEEVFEANAIFLLKKLVQKLDVDGLIVHVNPVQEWLQPEGDRFKVPPIETIKKLLNELNVQIIVKEVGQGFGKESILALLALPLCAIDFASNGGTNFAKLELLRNTALHTHFDSLVAIGHTAEEMTTYLNEAVGELGDKCLCKQVIVSGGVSDFLDGYYHISKSKLPAIYGQAAPFLKHAAISQEAVNNYAQHQVNGLMFAQSFLKVK